MGLVRQTYYNWKYIEEDEKDFIAICGWMERLCGTIPKNDLSISRYHIDG